MYTSEASRNTIARNPSHLGSKRKLPPSGKASASLASIGSIGGVMGIRPLVRGGILIEYRQEQHVAKLGSYRNRSSVVELSIRNPARPAPASAGRCVFKELGEVSPLRIVTRRLPTQVHASTLHEKGAARSWALLPNGSPKLLPIVPPPRDRVRSTCSRRAARELRNVLRERLRRELDALRERQVRMEGRGDVVDREPEPGREGRLGDHLPGLGREDVRADDLLGSGIRHELDESPGVMRGERPRHVLERQLGDERLDSLSACLVLGKTDGGDGGIGEGHFGQCREIVAALVHGQRVLSRQCTG